MLDDVKARVYVGIVSWLGLALFIVTLPATPFDEWRGILLFAILCGIAQSMPIYLFRSSAVSVAFAITFAALVLFGPVGALWVSLGGGIVAAFRPKRKPLYKAIFNVSNHALAVGVGGAVYLAAGGTVRPEQPLLAILPALLAGVSYFLTETLLLAGVISLTENSSFVKVWEINYAWSIFNFVSLAIIGLGLAIAERAMGSLGIAIFCIPLVIAWHSFQMYMSKSKEVRLQNETLRLTNEKLEESYVSTIRALAAAVDAKDHYTHGHSEMVMRYAVATAKTLQLSERDTAIVQLSALFHDIGKIGVTDGILNKPAQLTDPEWKVIREHPVIGAKLIQQIGSLQVTVPGILYHHERYDGKGYPSGLAGESIPLAAQIIAVADAYQAMSSARPYRMAFSRDFALEEVRRCAGNQFSPQVVEAFVATMQQTEAVEEISLPNLLRLCLPQEVIARG